MVESMKSENLRPGHPSLQSPYPLLRIRATGSKGFRFSGCKDPKATKQTPHEQRKNMGMSGTEHPLPWEDLYEGVGLDCRIRGVLKHFGEPCSKPRKWVLADGRS